jgi:hypothetical protein
MFVNEEASQVGGLFSFSSLLFGRGLSRRAIGWRRTIKRRRTTGTALAGTALTRAALALARTALALAAFTWAARLAAEVGVRV